MIGGSHGKITHGDSEKFIHNYEMVKASQVRCKVGPPLMILDSVMYSHYAQWEYDDSDGTDYITAP